MPDPKRPTPPPTKPPFPVAQPISKTSPKTRKTRLYSLIFLLGYFIGIVTTLLMIVPDWNQITSNLKQSLNQVPIIGFLIPDSAPENPQTQHQYIPPVTQPAIINSLYGYRIDPIAQQPLFHNGIDFNCSIGEPILAIANGIVEFSGSIPTDFIQGAYGNLIIINHENGYRSVYGHNSELLVYPGQKIQQGEAIARCGSTGRSSAPHSHLEIRKDNTPADPYGFPSLDPLPLLPPNSYQNNPLSSPEFLGGIK